MKNIITNKKIRPFFIIIFYLFLSLTVNTQWQQSSNGIEGKDLTQLYVQDNELWVGVVGSGLYKSTNEGVSWLLTYPTSYYPSKFAKNLGYIFYLSGYSGTRVYRTVNNGQNWEYVSSSTSGIRWDIIAFDDELYLASYGSGIYKSSIGGTWTLFNNGLNSLYVQSLGHKDNRVFSGSRANGVVVSTNGGGNWEPSNNGLNAFDILGFCSNNTGIFLFTDNDGNTSGVYYSSDYGTNWIFKGLTNKDIRSMVNINNVVFALVYNEGIFKTTNNGDNWTLVNDGITNLRSKHIGLMNNNLFYIAESSISTDKPVWKRPVIEIIGINTISSTAPEKFNISQNYPNPFNPSTKIRFDMPKSSFVKLVVYDVLGKEVAVLVNEELKAGEYSVDWSAEGGAGNYTSGIYFYKIQAGEFVETKKMVLLK